MGTGVNELFNSTASHLLTCEEMTEATDETRDEAVMVVKEAGGAAEVVEDWGGIDRDNDELLDIWNDGKLPANGDGPMSMMS